MKSKKNLLEQLKSLPYFTKNTVYQIGKHLGLSDSTIDTYISRFLKHKEIIAFKRGFYVSSSFFEKNKGDISYSFYLANILRTPSYVSSWTALQYYNLTTESIKAITSVTPKVTRAYQAKAGNFVYQSISESFFNGFSLAKGKFDFFIASPAKALFDLLYFRTKEFRYVKLADIDKLINELRVDVEEMNESEYEKFKIMIKKYFYE